MADFNAMMGQMVEMTKTITFYYCVWF